MSNLHESITILFYPSLFLVNQTYNTYKENTILKFNPLVVCSDTAIGDNENDDIFELDINEVKYPVTTNIEDIKIYLQDKSIKDKIVFITYQSCELIGVALNELDMKADLGIFDEAHKTATANIDSEFAYGLKDENIPIAKRLFMTATPRHIKFNSEDDDEVEVFSMNNPELYGNIAYEYPMREAINDGIITDYKIVGILIDDKYIDSYTNKVKPYSEDVINEAKIKAINEAMNKYGLNKALIFNRDIAASKELEKYSNTSIFNKTIKHLDGSSKHSYREQVLKELKDNEQYVITNAKLFTEGVDLPIIDMIALFRNVKSEIDIIQTVGRVQRIDKNNPNKVGYILLPIFVSNIDLIDEEIKTNKDLGYIFEVINSLKENDELLKTTLAYKKQNKSNKNDDSKIENPNFEIDYISSDDSLSKDYINEINEKIAYKIETVILNRKGILKTDKEWNELFELYDKEIGIENLRQITKYRGENLGGKSGKIKTLFIKSTPDEKQKIREFWGVFKDEFWEVNSYKSKDEWKQLFKEFTNEVGIANLKQQTVYKGERLGSKFNLIKDQYNKSTPEQQKERREFWDCFPDEFWENKTKSDEEWKKLFKEYGKIIGFNEFRTTTKYKGNHLGSKFSEIKTLYNKSDIKNKQEIMKFWDCFPSIFWGVIASKTLDEEWKVLFIDFDKHKGISNLKDKEIFKGKHLGSKLTNIKTKYNKSTPEQQKELREFWDCFSDEFWENKKERRSDKEWKELFEYFNREIGIENLKVTTIFEDNIPLGEKARTLKKIYKKSTIEKQLEMREFWDCFPDEFWKKRGTK